MPKTRARALEKEKRDLKTSQGSGLRSDSRGGNCAHRCRGTQLGGSALRQPKSSRGSTRLQELAGRHEAHSTWAAHTPWACALSYTSS